VNPTNAASIITNTVNGYSKPWIAETIRTAVKKAIDVKEIDPFKTSILLTALQTTG